MPRLRNADACVRAADGAFGWVRSCLDHAEDGPCAAYPLTAYHKVPYLFHITGRIEDCRDLLAHIQASLLTDSGDVLMRPDHADNPARPAPVREEGWIALAAHLAGRYDISYPLAAHLRARQGVRTGGVYDVAPDRNLQNNADVRSTACAGMTYLQCGFRAEARRAGMFLSAAVEPQTEAKRFYLRLDALCRLVRKFPKDQSAAYVLGKARGRTEFSYLGMPIVFLAKLYLATGEGEWLEAAMDYFTVAENCGRAAWNGPDVGALGWGAAILYDLTRRRLFYDAAEALTQSQVNHIAANGYWKVRNGSDQGAALHHTAETAVCLLESVREAR